uniref:Sel1 domain containing protein n=2 Tax=Burkholderiaceae TaxID=119060 RepID=A0A0C5B2C8_BURPE|nr:Sel1 domain containing protein [Burkholderia pseudomallei]
MRMQTTVTRLPIAAVPLSVTLALLCASAAFAEEQGIRPGEVKGFAESTFNSPVFKDLVTGFQQQNGSVMKSITTDVVERTKALLPKAQQLGERLRYGDHNVVSNDGEVVVMWIIEVANASPDKRKTLLEKLAGLSARGIPEAMTFEGFATEYGLFGVPKDLGSAMRLYRSAAAQNYQPAIYNLAIAAAYGKLQQPDVAAALNYAVQAAAIAPDASYRVCGFASFLSYRQGDRARAVQHAQSCWSDLAGIAKALYGGRATTAERVTMLRNSIGTGVDDGYPLLEKITHDVGAEPQYLACKYKLVNRYRRSLVNNTLRDDAVQCYRRYGIPTDPKEAAIRFNTVVPAIVGFVPTEIRSLEKLRASNKFHYGWSVPYLPFRQQDVDLFAPFVAHTKQ